MKNVFRLERACVCVCVFFVCFNLLLINPRIGHGEDTPLEQSVASQPPGTPGRAMAAPLAHQSSFVSCQGSGYQTPDTGPSSQGSRSSGTSSPARASVLSSSSSTGSVDSADAAVVIEPEINIMLCDDVMDYADVQSMSEEHEEPVTMQAVTAVSCQVLGNLLKQFQSSNFRSQRHPALRHFLPC